MVNFRKDRLATKIFLFLGLSVLGLFLHGETLKSKSDADQITSLMASLSDRSKAPADILDPALSASDRRKSLGHFSASKYELSVVPIEGIPEVAGDSASVPVRVHYKAEDGNSLDASAMAKFVRRDRVWYFSNFDFMEWPAFLIIVLVVGLLVGISYAAMVLVLWKRLSARGTLGFNGIKIFIPFFWPSLFRRVP